jgi:2,5-furandicarboxylate decarboxylase 1
MDLKQVTVVDEDIDVFDADDVEFAVATRVQADRDVVIVSNARAKPLDPSLRAAAGQVPTGAKMGIDATMPEGLPRERFERIAYPRAGGIDVSEYLAGKADAAPVAGSDVAAAVLAAVANEPLYYSVLRERLGHVSLRAIAAAVGALNRRGMLWQDAQGRLCRADSALAARAP